MGAKRGAVVSVLVGVAAFLLVFAEAFLARGRQDVRPYVTVVYLAFFAGTLLRTWRPSTRHAAEQTAWLLLGGFAPVLLLRWSGVAFTATSFVLLYVEGALVAAGVALVCAMLMQRRRWLAGVAGVVAVAALCAYAWVAVPARIAARSVTLSDRPVAAFTIEDENGSVLRSQDLAGHVVVLAFWATWCAPCREELPEIARLAAQYKADPRVRFLAVNAQTYGDTPDKARLFLAQTHLALPLATDNADPGDADGWGQAATSFGVQHLPTVCILDAKGNLRMMHQGFDDSEDFAGTVRSNIARALRE